MLKLFPLPPKLITRIEAALLLCAVALPHPVSAAVQEPSPRPPATVHASTQKVYALRLQPGQDLRVELERFTKTAGLRAGYIITCVGSLNHANLRLANQENSTHFVGKFEIVSLVGTLTPAGPHLHLAVADNTGKMLGGHLVAGCEIYTTAEIVIGEAQDLLFTREPDAASGYQELTVRRRKRVRRRS